MCLYTCLGKYISSDLVERLYFNLPRSGGSGGGKWVGGKNIGIRSIILV